MAKADVASCRKKQGKEDSVNTEGQTETVSSSEQTKDAPVESTEMKLEEENQDEQDPQMDIEVKGSKPTVTVSWDQKSEEEKENDSGEPDISLDDEVSSAEDIPKGQTETVSSSKQTKDAPVESTEMKLEEENQDEQDPQMDIEVKGSKPTVTVSWDQKSEEEKENDSGESDISLDDEVSSAEDIPSESTETNVNQEIQESAESEEDTVTGENESTPTETVTLEKKNDEGESKDIQKKTKRENGKRKATSTDETSPSKKTKLINDGYCLYVGNLDNSKKFQDVRESLANYFMTQSLLVQDIRLDRSRKHAYIDLASEMDLTKGLTLNGEMLLDKPMRIAKAKIKSEENGKVKVSAAERRAARDARCLFLKNVPFNATKQDIMKIFRKAAGVRFPGGSETANRGIAFVEFKNKTIAKKVQQKKRVARIRDQVLIVDRVGEANKPKDAPANEDNKNKTKAPAVVPPNNTLFVSNLSYNVKESNLKNVFKKAVSIKMPQNQGKSKGYAFVEFANVEDAEKALQASQKLKICTREVKIQFYEKREKTESVTVLSDTLIVRGLTKKTTAETLKTAFEGSLSTRVCMDKETGLSKGFGFVEFGNAENCKAVKEAMQDCEIDGSKVTVEYAKPKVEKGNQPAGQRAARRGVKDKGGRGGSRGGFRGRGTGRPQKLGH